MTCRYTYAFVLVVFVIVNFVLLYHWRSFGEAHKTIPSKQNVPSALQVDARGARLGGRFRCIDGATEFTDLLRAANQTFALAAAKCGGSTLKQFAKECKGGNKTGGNDLADNIIERADLHKGFLTHTFHPQALVSSHLYRDKTLVELIRFSALSSLLIFSYRSETDRLASAIANVMRNRICFSESDIQLITMLEKNGTLERSDTKCVIDEKILIGKFIATNFREIGKSTTTILSCDVWNAIDEMEPNLVFVDFTRLDVLQQHIANHLCPRVIPIQKNVRADSRKGTQFFVRTANSGISELYEWIDAKKASLEFWLKMPQLGCRKELRRLESSLHHCEGFVRVFPKDIQ